MYLPPHFREERVEVNHELIRSHPLGLLITAGSGGLLANPVPFVLYSGEGEWGTLRAHVARGNPHWKELAAVSECLVVFQGPQSYITPNWYATKHETGKVVPTWNYATVHVWGAPRVMDDIAWIRRQIEDLTNSQEQRRPQPWSVGDAPEEYVAGQAKGIVGIEIPIVRMEGKWKVSQNRSDADRAGVIAGLRSDGGPADAVAALVEKRMKE